MYSTKFKVHSKADLGALSISTGKDGQQVQEKNSRFVGKQIAVSKVNGFFQVFPFQVEGKRDNYNERVSYRDIEKNLGFGSGDAPKRDEFSNTIAIEQYRESIHHVNASQAKAAKKLQASKGGDQALPAPMNQEEKKEEVFVFDQAFSVKPDEIGVVRQRNKIDLGALRTTTSLYGEGCEKPKETLKNRRTVSKFYSNNHLRVGEDDE